MSNDWLDRKEFWRNKRVCVTGGAGFLGSYVVETLRVRERGCGEVFVPRSKDYDLTQLPGVQKLYADARPDFVIHPSTPLPAGAGLRRAGSCGARGRHPTPLRCGD
jgi:GDP-L-fucose synthase